MNGTTAELRSIYSGPIRRALENLERKAAAGGGGGGGTDEVWIGTGTPPGAQELWYDTDDPASMAGMPAVFSVAGISLSGAFNPAAATVATLVVPAQPVAGMLMVHSLTLFSRTSPAASDIDEYSLLRDGTILAQGRVSGDGGWFSGVLQCSTALAASTAATLTVTLLRSAGTGNRQVFADSRNNRIDAMWMAT